MDVTTLRKQTVPFLTNALSEAQARLRELSFHLASNQVKNVREIRQLRSHVARIHMAMKEKQKAS